MSFNSNPIYFIDPYGLDSITINLVNVGTGQVTQGNDGKQVILPGKTTRLECIVKCDNGSTVEFDREITTWEDSTITSDNVLDGLDNDPHGDAVKSLEKELEDRNDAGQFCSP